MKEVQSRREQDPAEVSDLATFPPSWAFEALPWHLTLCTWAIASDNVQGVP